MRGRVMGVLVATAALVLAAVPLARSQTAPAPAACVESPRPDPALPVLAAQAQGFGFHDEELVLCSPGSPAEDGPAHLAARLWVPASCSPAGGCPGVVVVHGFGVTKETTFADMRDLALRGLYVLAYDVRGQGQSGGRADFMGPDTIADQAYVLQWFHQHVQPSKVGVYGISQGGSHALMAAIYNCGPARAAQLDSTVPCDEGGTRWVDAVVPVQAPADMERVVDDGTCTVFLAQAAAESRVQADLTADATRCLLDGTAPDAAVEEVHGDRGLARHNGLRDLVARTDRIDVPVYLATSYFDRLVPAAITTDIYERLHARRSDRHDPYHGTDVRLIVSNDAHGDVGANFAVLGDLFTWLERQLKGDATPLRAAPVASQQEWDANTFRLEPAWPIPSTRTDRLYLAVDEGGARLGGRPRTSSRTELANVPVVRSAPWVPVAGAPAGTQTTGMVPGDSVAYESAPFTRLTEITGLLKLQLWLSTLDGGPQGQLTASLEEVAPDGTATQFARVRRGFDDLSGTPVAKAFNLSTASWRIDPGNRLRLTITVTDVFEAAPLANRGIVISHGRRMASRVDLAVVDADRTPPPGEPPAGAAFGADPIAALCDAFAADC